MNLEKLHSAVAAVCPINGVCIGDASDKSTWTFDALAEATAEQRAAAQAVIDATDVLILDDVQYIPVRSVFERLIVAGKAETVWTALTTAQQLNFLTLEKGIDVNDTQVKTLLSSLEIDPDTILY